MTKCNAEGYVSGWSVTDEGTLGDTVEVYIPYLDCDPHTFLVSVDTVEGSGVPRPENLEDIPTHVVKVELDDEVNPTTVTVLGYVGVLPTQEETDNLWNEKGYGTGEWVASFFSDGSSPDIDAAYAASNPESRMLTEDELNE